MTTAIAATDAPAEVSAAERLAALEATAAPSAPGSSRSPKSWLPPCREAGQSRTSWRPGAGKQTSRSNGM